jgi:hypothetical protein
MEISGLLGVLILIGILCISAWAIQAVLASMGIPIPGVVRIIVIAVIGILILLLLASALGINVPALR